jgi:hypothetical protein
MPGMLNVALLVIALGVASSATADVYKCQKADGSIEYRGSPCEGGRKIETEFNSVGETHDPQIEAQQRAFAIRHAERVRATHERLRDRADMDRVCQGYLDDIERQNAWLLSKSKVVRASALTEIDISERKWRESGC